MATWRTHIGDVIDVVRAYPDNHFDGMLTDPPYGLSEPLTPAQMTDCLQAWILGKPYKPRRSGGFMGKEWDAFIPGPEYWRELFRVLKPGASAFVFAGTRTKGLMEVALTLAGFEVVDVKAWLYGSGFPKSMDVSKAIDSLLGAEREVVGTVTTNVGMKGGNFSAGSERGEVAITAAATDEAKAFEGYGLALKPGWEPCILVRKPPEGTWAVNAIVHGVAGLNIDGGRIATDEARPVFKNFVGDAVNAYADGFSGSQRSGETTNEGRWPANVAFDEAAAAELDRQSGVLKSGVNRPEYTRKGPNGNGRTHGLMGSATGPVREADSGGASRFFYVAKPGRKERDAGLAELEDSTLRRLNPGGLSDDPRFAPREVKNAHPTVKPIALNRQLATLLLPPAREHDVRRLLVPFGGSGSEGIGGMLAGWDDVTFVELDPQWEAVIDGRMRYHHDELQSVPGGSPEGRES